MKRFLAAALTFIMLAVFSGCAAKDAVQKGTQSVLDNITGSSGNSGSQGTKPTGSANDEKPTISNGGLPPIAAIPEGASYWERLEHEWKNAPNEGYVWTIHIDDTDVIDVLGLATATYHVNLSVSHIGKDMYGAYFGEFGFESSTDLGGFEAITEALGGGMSSDTDLWLKNERFVFSLDKYDELEESQLQTAVSSNSEYEEMSAEEQAMMNSLLGEVYKKEEQDFEKNTQPEAMWWDFDMAMTDGDLGANITMSLYGGLVSGYSETDESGKNIESAMDSIVGSFRESGSLKDKFGERYGTDDNFNYPCPYTLKVYPNNQVVMTFYSLDGSPVTVKCYGTIDKVPVEDTIVVD